MNISVIVQRLQQSELFLRFFKSTSWALFGTMVAKGSLMLTWFLIGRILEKEQYGEFGIIRSNIDSFAVFGSFGISLIGNSLVSKLRDTQKVEAGNLIGLSYLLASFFGFITFLFVLCCAGFIARSFLNDPGLENNLRLSSIIIFFYALNGCQIGILSGLEAFKSISIINIICSAISIPVLLIFAYFWGVSGTIIGFMFEIFLIAVLSYLFIRKALLQWEITVTYKNTIKNHFAIIRDLCIPAVLSGLMVAPIRFCASAIFYSEEGGKSDIGIFTILVTIQTLVLFVGNTLNAPFLTFLSSVEAENSIHFKKINILSSWLIGIFCVLPFIFFPELLLLLLGKDYQGTEFTLSLLLIMSATVIMMYKQGLARVLVVKNMMWFSFGSNLLWGASLLIVTLFMKSYGTIGLSASYLIAYTVVTIFMIPVYIHKKLIPQSTLTSANALKLWGLFIGITVLLLFNISLPVKIILFVLTNLGVFYFAYNIMKGKAPAHA